MSSPTTPSTGYAAQGVTTIVWGTDALWGSYVVTRFNQKQLVENIKLTNGTGITTTRIQLKDGAQWDITVRDDTAMTPPTVGTTLSVVDGGGLLGAVGVAYTGRVIDSGWEVSPKQPGERTITVEKLTLITEA